MLWFAFKNEFCIFAGTGAKSELIALVMVCFQE